MMIKQKPIYVFDEIGYVVEQVSNSLTIQLQNRDINDVPTNSITGVHYTYGHPMDIKKKLMEMSQTNEHKFDRFPLVALFMPFTEKFDDNGRLNVDLQLILGHHSQIQIPVEEREEKVFKPVLYPMYMEFKKQLALNPVFTVQQEEGIVHEKIDRPHWGNSGEYGTVSYIFSEVLDCIEIRNLNLGLDPSYCGKKGINLLTF